MSARTSPIDSSSHSTLNDSPSLRGLRRGCHLISYFCLFIKLVLIYWQPGVLAIIVSVFGFLYSQESMTQGWAYTKRYGFLQNAVCDGSKRYDVRNVSPVSPNDDFTTTGRVYAPMIGSLDTSSASKGSLSLCFTASGAQSFAVWLSTNSIRMDISTLGEVFESHAQRYTVIYFASWILTVSAVALFINLFFLCDLFEFVTQEQGRFVTQDNILVITRTHTGLIVLLVALLVGSSSNFTLLKEISSCALEYSGTDNLCTLLAQTDVRIGFVLFPSTGVVLDYRALSLFLALCVILSCFIRIKPNPRQYGGRHRVAVAEGEEGNLDRMILSVNTRLGALMGGSQVMIRDGRTLLLVPRASGQGHTNQTGSRLTQEFLHNQQRIWVRNAAIARWKQCTSEEIDPERSCSICLEPLGGGKRPFPVDDLEEGHLQHGLDVFQLPCSHFFHRTCITEWCVKGEASCPECRAPLLSSAE